jgi:hypothetical protein
VCIIAEQAYNPAHVLCISYDQLRIHADVIRKIPGVDLIVCDEVFLFALLIFFLSFDVGWNVDGASGPQDQERQD